MTFTRKALVLFALYFPLLSYANNGRNKDNPDSDSLQLSYPKFTAKPLIIPASLMIYGAIETLLAPKYRVFFIKVWRVRMHSFILHSFYRNGLFYRLFFSSSIYNVC